MMLTFSIWFYIVLKNMVNERQKVKKEKSNWRWILTFLINILYTYLYVHRDTVIFFIKTQRSH